MTKIKAKKQPLTNDQLLQMLKSEIEKNGPGIWSDRRKTIEEMLRIRGVALIAN